MPKPARPVASNNRLAGSGTLDGLPFTNIAPLFAVAWKLGAVAVPSFKNPTMYDASGTPGLMFSSGDTFGLDGLWRVAVPRSTWYTKKWGSTDRPATPGGDEQRSHSL